MGGVLENRKGEVLRQKTQFFSKSTKAIAARNTIIAPITPNTAIPPSINFCFFVFFISDINHHVAVFRIRRLCTSKKHGNRQADGGGQFSQLRNPLTTLFALSTAFSISVPLLNTSSALRW